MFMGGLMPEVDEWGKDPQVRYLRQVFARIDALQGELLERLNISPFDYRLSRIRDAALKSFEKAWVLAVNRGIATNEEEIATLYIHCLARMLSANCINVPVDILPAHEKIAGIIKEVLK
jgi:hypothetical protein